MENSDEKLADILNFIKKDPIENSDKIITDEILSESDNLLQLNLKEIEAPHPSGKIKIFNFYDITEDGRPEIAKHYAKVVYGPIQSLRDIPFLSRGENKIREKDLILHVVYYNAYQGNPPCHVIYVHDSNNQFIESFKDFTKDYYDTMKKISRLVTKSLESK
jgi:hypothetical protein